MKEVDGAYRDIPTLFIELRNPKIKSCHCNYTREKTKRLTGEKERERGSRVWPLLRKRIGFDAGISQKLRVEEILSASCFPFPSVLLLLILVDLLK